MMVLAPDLGLESRVPLRATPINSMTVLQRLKPSQHTFGVDSSRAEGTLLYACMRSAIEEVARRSSKFHAQSTYVYIFGVGKESNHTHP